jgi:hypothetical protein
LALKVPVCSPKRILDIVRGHATNPQRLFGDVTFGAIRASWHGMQLILRDEIVLRPYQPRRTVQVDDRRRPWVVGGNADYRRILNDVI